MVPGIHATTSIISGLRISICKLFRVNFSFGGIGTISGIIYLLGTFSSFPQPVQWPKAY